MNTRANTSLVFLCGLLASVLISKNIAAAQQVSPVDSEVDPSLPIDATDAKAIDFSRLDDRQGDVDNGDDAWRNKRPGGRMVTASEDKHSMAKRPGARFIAPVGGFGGGGLMKRPGGRHAYTVSSRSKRPGGRYYGYQGDVLKRLGGRYTYGSGRGKRAGGRYLGNGYNSFYGKSGGRGARRSYNWRRR